MDSWRYGIIRKLPARTQLRSVHANGDERRNRLLDDSSCPRMTPGREEERAGWSASCAMTSPRATARDVVSRASHLFRQEHVTRVFGINPHLCDRHGRM